MLKLSRQNASFRQSLSEIAAGKRAVGSFLAMDHQVVEIENLAAGSVMAFVFGIVAEIFIRNDDVASSSGDASL